MDLYRKIIEGIEENQSSGKSKIDYLTSLKDEVKALRKAYWKSPVHVDYGIEPIQSAYLITYFPHYYHLIYKILIEQKAKIRSFSDKDELTFTLIGGGPGSEAFGVIQFVADFLPDVNKVYINILDINAIAWKYSHKIVEEHLLDSLVNSQLDIEWQSHFLDLTDKASIGKHKDLLKRTDLATVQNCINEIGGSHYNSLEENLLFIYEALPQPSNLLLIDLTTSIRNTLRSLEKRIKDVYKPDQIFSTLGNASPSSMVSLNAYPNEEVRKHVLTGADGLIPRKNLKYDYTLFFKGAIEKVSKANEEEEFGFSSFYGPMNGKVLSSISGIHDQAYIGIDFGTSVSVASIAYVKNDEVHVESLELPQKDHNGFVDTSPLLPSAIGILNKRYMVGKHAAQNLARLDIGKNAFCMFKDHLGSLESQLYPDSQLYDHPSKPINNAKDALIDYLKYFREAINKTLSEKETSGTPVYCWSVPVDYPLHRKNQLIECASAAGFNMDNISIIEEPVSALLNYVHENNATFSHESQNILVVDLGAGTFDISIMEMSKDTDNINANLLAVKREKAIGGNLINRLMVKKISRSHPTDKDLFYHCEKLKREICANIRTDRSVDYALPEIVDSEMEVSVPLVGHAEYLRMKYSVFTEIMRAYWSGNHGVNLQHTIESGLNEADLEREDIDLLILTGGGLRNPYIQSYMSTFFPNAELKLSDNIQEQVARGNALQSLAHHVFGKSIVNPVLHHDVTYMVSDTEEQVLFSKGETCPTENIHVDIALLEQVTLLYGNEKYYFEWSGVEAKQLSLSIDNNLTINAEIVFDSGITQIKPRTTSL